MPKFGVTVEICDEGGFVIEADSWEEAQAKLDAMERDGIESRTHFRKDYSSWELEEPEEDEKEDEEEDEKEDEPARRLLPDKPTVTFVF